MATMPSADRNFITGQRLEVRLLRAFSVSGVQSQASLGMMSQRLLAFVAAQGRPVLRKHAAEMLWPEADCGRAYSSLRTALSRLRRSLGAFIVDDGGALALDPRVDVDLHRFGRLAEDAVDGRTLAAEARQEAVAAWSSDLLPDWYDEWLAYERERWRQIRLYALESDARAQLACGAWAAATKSALSALASEPLRETAHLLLVQIHLAQGNRAAALVQFSEYKTMMEQELDLPPSPEMSSLFESSDLQPLTAKRISSFGEQ